MNIDSRSDRMRTPVSLGIPGANSQPPLPRRSWNPARSGSSRSNRRAMRALSSQELNGLLADSMMLYDHYRKYQWLVTDDAGDLLSIVLDEHATDQCELIDLIAERVQCLGDVATAPLQVAGLTVIARPPNGAEDDIPAMLARLLEAHGLVISRTRDAITAITTNHDDATTDLLQEMLRRHELQAWTVAQKLADSDAICA